jgi:ubiquinone/menaquinone biosynthesis C-methylase UbiE
MRPTKEEYNKVDQEWFWKERIELAEKAGNLYESVFQCDKNTWSDIWNIHQEIIKKVIPKDAKVLDAACGYGRCSVVFDPKNYLGVDFSPDFIKQAKDIYLDYKFKQADCKKLPFENKEFDWVLAMSFKKMIKHYLGESAWTPIEKELKRVGKNVLILEYTNPETYEIL